MSLDQGPFPWRSIGKVVLLAGASFAALVGYARKVERDDYAEANRTRWTDEARWDK